MIDRAAFQISADRHTEHYRRRKFVSRAPAQHCQLVANLVKGGPDVVEELNLNDRLQAARGHADSSTHDVSFRQRRIEYPCAAKLALQICRDFEYAAFAFDLVEKLL